MKLAWICYDDPEDSRPVIKFSEPEPYMFWRIVPIVYAEIQPEPKQ